jgi:hypothetical protein
LGVFSDFTIQVFNEICCVDNRPDFSVGSQKKGSQFFPVFTPAFDCIAIFGASFGGKVIKGGQGSLSGWCCIDIFHIFGKFPSIFPNHITATVTYLMYNSLCNANGQQSKS